MCITVVLCILLLGLPGVYGEMSAMIGAWLPKVLMGNRTVCVQCCMTYWNNTMLYPLLDQSWHHRVDQDYAKCRVPWWKVISRRIKGCMSGEATFKNRVCECVWDEGIAGGFLLCTRMKRLHEISFTGARRTCVEGLLKFSVSWTPIPSIRRAREVYGIT